MQNNGKKRKQKNINDIFGLLKLNWIGENTCSLNVHLKGAFRKYYEMIHMTVLFKHKQKKNYCTYNENRSKIQFYLFHFLFSVTKTQLGINTNCVALVKMLAFRSDHHCKYCYVFEATTRFALILLAMWFIHRIF